MIYFDNSATTPLCSSAAEAIGSTLREAAGNPSSSHSEGRKAAALLRKARHAVADSLNVKADTLYFTASGTLSDNIAVLGGAKKGVGNRLVTTALEHDAVLKAFHALEKQGFEVSYVLPDEDGNISAEAVGRALSADTSLVSIMAVNNETGAVMPIKELRRLIDKTCPRALFHIDAVQAFGKRKLYPEALGADLVSISAHKIHGPKGAGALYVKKGVSLNPLFFGGGQEKGVHSGTENLPAIMGFAAACKEIDYNTALTEQINAHMRREIESIKCAKINSPGDADPHILNASFGNIPSEVLLNALDGEGICASAGSACSANKSGESHVLTAMGINPHSAIRFSFSRYNTLGEAERVIEFLKKTVPVLEAVVKGQR